MKLVDDADDWRDVVRMRARRDDTLDVWLRRSPRRALSPSRKRVVIARRRPWPGADGYVMNVQPPPGARPDQVVWSLDIFDGGNWGRVTLPLGVAVESLALPENDRLQVRFVFDDAAAGELGLGTNRAIDASLSPVWANLNDLPEPPRAQSALRVLAKILHAAGVDAGNIATLGDEQAAAERRADEQRRRAEERRHAAIWKAHARRGRRDLGPLAKRLDTAVAAAGLGGQAGAAFAGDLARLARVCVAAVAAGPAPEAPVGASRMGGLPDLPAGSRWPSTGGELLSFTLQIDLGAVPAVARGNLPSGGLLSLFVGENDSTTKVEHRVLLSPRRGLRRCALPRDARFRDEDTGVIDPIGLALEPALSLPDYGSDELAALGARHEFLSDALDAYLAMVRALLPKDIIASMFGYPSSDEAAANAARAVVSKRARDARDPDRWVNLLRVRSYLPAGLNFWDAGDLDLMVPRAAVARRSFDASYAEITTS